MALKFDEKIFYHIPKCGGMYVRRAIENSGAKTIGEISHVHAGPMRNLKEHSYKDSFCVVRHPLSWYESFFRYRAINGWRVVWAEEASNSAAVLDRQCKHESFQGFIVNVLNAYPSGFVTNLYMRFVPFCKYVLHQENLTEELYGLLKSWGYNNAKSSRVNPSVGGIGTTLTDALKQRLLRAESEIIAYLKY